MWSGAGCAAVGSAAAALGVSPLESPDDVEANPPCVASGAARLLAPVLTECEVRSDPVLCVPVVAAADGPIPAAGAVVAVGAEPAAVWFTEPEAGLGTGLVPDAGWAVVTGAACEPLAGVACPPVAGPALAAGSGVT
ncbi:MAG TPA: hypothetical protein VGL88_10995 [Pseudonocardiaceae bacterium]